MHRAWQLPQLDAGSGCSATSIYTNTHTRTHTYIHTRTHTHTHTHTRAHNYTHTHTHTHGHKHRAWQLYAWLQQIVGAVLATETEGLAHSALPLPQLHSETRDPARLLSWERTRLQSSGTQSVFMCMYTMRFLWCVCVCTLQKKGVWVCVGVAAS